MKCCKEHEHIGMLIRNIDKKIKCTFDKELDVFDITLMQSEILRYIYCQEKNQDVFQKQIEEYFNSSNPTITGILKRLEAKQLIRRELSLTDARYKKLTLTDKGKEITEQALKVGPQKIESRLTSKLSSEEASELKRLLILVLEGINE